MIVAGLYNQDSSFFEITSPSVTTRVLSDSIISFSYTEECSRYNTGTLQIFDPDQYYSNILRLGTPIEIEFGYSKQDNISISNQINLLNPNQVTGINKRSGIRATIQNPSGRAGADGVIIFNCNFYGSEYLNPKKYKVWTGITKAQMVWLVLIEIGCNIDSIEVNFSRGNEFLDLNTQIIQRETGYRLLMRLASEWRTIFRISYDSKGTMSGIFVSPGYIQNANISRIMSGAIGGNSIFIEYQFGVCNVIEYEWKNHAGDGGSGDNARIVYGADGTPTIMRYVTEGDKVVVYRLVPERIQKKLEKAGSLTDRIELMKAWMGASEFSEIKWAFDQIEQTTAPQGLGYSMNVKMFGNPLTSVPLRVIYGKGFPRWFSDSKGTISNYYCKKVNHTIDRGGYKMDLEIMDAFTMNGGSLL